MLLNKLLIKKVNEKLFDVSKSFHMTGLYYITDDQCRYSNITVCDLFECFYRVISLEEALAVGYLRVSEEDPDSSLTSVSDEESPQQPKTQLVLNINIILGKYLIHSLKQ